MPEREQPLFTHLAQALTPAGCAVLSFDRRECEGDVPLAVQAQDAMWAAAALRGEIDAPIGLFGFSQGAWAAGLAASLSDDFAFLIVVGCSGVSPAEQMRYFTDEALRRAGVSGAERIQARELRLAMESVWRGAGDRTLTRRLLADAARRPWFDFVYLPAELPAEGELWADVDYDPRPSFEQVRCPALVMYGEDEESVPSSRSKDVWQRAAETSGNADVTIVDLPGCGHFPATPRPLEQLLNIPVEDISSEYTATLQRWFVSVA